MGGFYQDLRKHEGAVPARVNEVLALLYGGEHLAPRPPVFTFLRPSPGGKLARIIVYKITIQLSNSGMRLIRARSSLSG